MRLALSLTALLTATAATAGDGVVLGAPTFERAPATMAKSPVIDTGPRRLDGMPQTAPGGTPACRDRIHEVRNERGLPPLDRENARPGEELLIAAVDHRVDGCSMMVMRNDTSDIRPVPTVPEGSPRLRRIQ